VTTTHVIISDDDWNCTKLIICFCQLHCPEIVSALATIIVVLIFISLCSIYYDCYSLINL